MARTVKDEKIGTREARRKLKARGKPYWRTFDGGNVHIGYRKNRDGGRWCVRRYIGDGRYEVQTLDGIADDAMDADDRSVLDFAQAIDRARAVFLEAATAGPRSALTVRAAFAQYIAYLRRHKSPSAAYNADGFLLGSPGKRGKARKCALTNLHDIPLADLSTAHIEAWQDAQVTAKDEEGRRRQKDTCNRQLNAIKAALSLAADNRDNRYPAAAPRQWERVKAFEDVARPRKVHLQRDQMRRLLNAIGRGALHDLVNAAFLTGIRPGNETKALTVGSFEADPDTGTGTLTLRPIRPTAKARGRVIFINSDAVQLFERLTAGRKADEPMFLKDDGQPWGDGKEWDRPLKEAASRLGLPTGRGGVCLYTMRHSHISQALVAKKRMPLQMLAENAGTSQKMIEKNYGKFTDQDRRHFVEAGTVKLGLGKSNVRKLQVRR